VRAYPTPGIVAVADEIPACEWASSGDCTPDSEGRYDFRTLNGAWANGCRGHFAATSASNELGVGHGQYLVTEAEVGSPVLPAFVEGFVANAGRRAA
jgi:hypothetical protein